MMVKIGLISNFKCNTLKQDGYLVPTNKLFFQALGTGKPNITKHDIRGVEMQTSELESTEE